MNVSLNKSATFIIDSKSTTIQIYANKNSEF